MIKTWNDGGTRYNVLNLLVSVGHTTIYVSRSVQNCVLCQRVTYVLLVEQQILDCVLVTQKAQICTARVLSKYLTCFCASM